MNKKEREAYEEELFRPMTDKEFEMFCQKIRKELYNNGYIPPLAYEHEMNKF